MTFANSPSRFERLPIPSQMRTVTLFVFLVITLAIGGPSAFAQSMRASVETDAPSYAAGARVFITGSGFAPNEVVTLQVIHNDGTAEAEDGHDPWSVTADAAGQFTTTWFVTTYDPVSDAFLLIADGMTSRRGASTTFTHETGLPPSLKTDQTDYVPGQTAIIWGSDFWPNETVTLQVFHTDPGTGWGAGHDPWNVVADADGNFMSNWYVNPDDSLGRNFLLTADGLTSGLQAEMTFVDAAGPLTITLGSQETLWLDANKCSAEGPRAAWLSFIIKNTGTDPVYNVTVSFAGFTGTNASYFSAPSDLTRTFSMIPGSSTVLGGGQEPVYFYVDYSEVCNHPQGGGSPYAGYTANYTLTVTSTNGGTATRNGTVTTNELITASAAGLALSTSLGPGIYVGQLLTQTVAYQFGNNSDLFFQPAGEAGFDAQCIRLVGSEITAVSGTVSPSLIGLKDQLWFPTASVSGGGGNIYLTYTWQILCVNRTQTLHPWAAAKSGNKYKYSGFQFSTVFPASQQVLTASKSVDPESVLTTPPTGVVTWTVTFSNPTQVPLRVSKITDVIPTCMSINDPDAPGSQVTAANSSSIPSAGAIGTVNWVGLDFGDSPSSTYQVPANGTLVLKYTTNVSGCSYPASYTNSATGTVGTTTVGPVQATVIIGGLPGIALVKSATPPTYSAVGQTITYTYTITNTGNVDLAGPFSVTDNKLGVISPCGSGTLVHDASTSCQVSYTITQEDLNAGSIVNTATASTTYNGNTVTSNQSTATVTAVQTKALALTKSASQTTYSAVGQTITYTYTITNTGNVTLAGPFTVTDNKQGSFTCGSSPLAPGAWTTCTSTHTITQADLDAGSIVNTAIASGSGVSSNQASATVAATQTPHLSLTKVATELSFTNPGDVIHYTLTATNDGNVTLTNVSISDPLLGPLTCTQPVTLAPGGTLTCTGSHTVTAADIQAGSFNNTATATGTDPTNTTVTATASSAVPPLALTLAKSASPMTYDHVGQVITYTYTITNTGNVNLTGPFSVADDKATVTCSQPVDNTLSPGETMTCSASYTITQADIDAGSLTNTATASGGGATSSQASATTNATQDKALTLAKTADPTTYSAVGQVITYTYTLTNIGSVTLSGPFSVSDSNLGTVSCGSGSLAPGNSTTCTATYTITQADFDAGSVLNAATATAYYNNQPVTSNQATALVTATQAPHLSLTKQGFPTTFSQVGEVITYTLIATNDGDVTLTNVSINDPFLGTLSCIPAQPTTLAPGATLTCTGIHTITADDLTAGHVTNTASATGTDPTNTPVVATASATIPPLGLALAKTADPMTYDHVGQVITYTYTITNTGSVTLSGPFAVTDDKLGTISPCGITSLDPGQSTSCTATYTITQADLDGNYVVNSAIASGGGVTTAPSTAVVSATQAPHLSLTKTGNPAIFTAAGQVITYTLVATNDGNVTLTNVTISDPLLGTLSCTPPQPAILAPGGTLTCTGTYTTTEADLAAGYKINTATATGTDPTNTPVVATASASVPPLALTLTKTADPMTYGLVGQVITYTYTITNTGAVTLEGPFSVTDNKLGTLANCAIGPLAVGASTTCTAQYTITQADLDAGSITNSATASGNGVTTIPSTAIVTAAQRPELTLVKTASPMTFNNPSDVITYTYTITNSGNITLGPAQFTVSDDHIGSPLGDPFNCGPAGTTLAPGGTLSCTASYSVTSDDKQAGSITNTALASGGGVTSNQATVTVTTTAAPVLTLAKTSVLDMTVVAPANRADVGDKINYTLLATNFGNVTLTNVTISDPLLGTLSCTPPQPATLAPGGTLTCTGTYTLTLNDLNAGKVDNTATATGNYGNQSVPSNPASTTVTIAVARITVDKVTIPAGASQLFSFVTAGGAISDSFELADATPPHETWVTSGTSYKVTETVPAGWVQTATCAGGPFGSGGTYTNGATFTVDPGDQITCTFTNRRAPTVADFCSKSEPQTVLNPSTGRFGNNKGFDVVVRTDLRESIQGVLDTVMDYNADGYIIVGVSNSAAGGYGGHPVQSVDITRNYPLPFGLFGCSVSLHDPTPGDAAPAGHIASTANAPVPTGQTGNIFVMDLHGADSQVAGWKVEGNGRYLRNVYGTNNATGVWFVGNNNTMHNGKGESNTGVGILIQGNGNKVDSADSFSNGSYGIQVTGNNNTVLKTHVGDIGKGNGAGILVSGSGNLLQENTVHASGGDGIKVTGGVAGSPNVIVSNSVGDIGKGNGGHGIFIFADAGSGAGGPIEIDANTVRSNGGDGFRVDAGATGHDLRNNTSGGTSSQSNVGCEYNISAGNFNQGGNSANGATVGGTTGGPFPVGCGEGKADLLETALSNPPSIAGAGTSFSVTDTVTNSGDVTSASSKTYYYLSADGVKDGGDLLLTGSRSVAGLAAGASSSGTVSVTIPASTPLATYYLLACADGANAVSESDETNNCRASSTTMQVVVAQPDLVETAVSNPPAAAAPGTGFSVTDSTQNQGGATAASSKVYYYLSVDNLKGAGDLLLTGSRSVASLAAGATSSGTVSVTIPASAPLGTYYLLACADGANAVSESNEANNCLASASTIAVARPDLVETAVSNPPASAVPGAGFSVTDSTQNQGGATAASSKTYYYLSVDNLKDAGDLLLTGSRSVASLAAGATSSGTVSVTIPASAPLGTYYLLACADGANAVSESNEANNCLASASTIAVTRPDLVETAVSNPPASAKLGGKFSVTDTVANQGNATAASSRTYYYLSVDGVKDSGDKLLTGNRSVNSLAAGATSTGTVTVTIPTSTVVGTYYLLACADGASAVAESNETNNCRASSTQVNVTP